MNNTFENESESQYVLLENHVVTSTTSSDQEQRQQNSLRSSRQNVRSNLDQFSESSTYKPLSCQATSKTDSISNVHERTMLEMFPRNERVYVNPENITPSLQTSIILRDSQVVGRNGLISSFHTDSLRSNIDLCATSQSGTSTIYPTLDFRPSHSGVVGAADVFDISTRDGYGELSNSTMENSAHISASVCWCLGWWCCGHSRQRSGGQDIMEMKSPSLFKFFRSLWFRTCTNWDSYIFVWALRLALITIPLAIGVSWGLKAWISFNYKSRCRFTREGGQDVYDGDVASLVLFLLPVANRSVLLFLSVWVGIICSQSRKRVLRSSPSSMTIDLTSSFILPCYEAILYTMALLNAISLALYIVSFYPIANGETEMGWSYPCDIVRAPNVWMLLLLPLLMVQHSVSHHAVRRAILYAGLCCAGVIMSILSFSQLVFNLNIVSVLVHVLLLGLFLWAKFVFHARSSYDFFLVYAVSSSLVSIIAEICAITHHDDLKRIAWCVVSGLEPLMTVAFLLSLRADTRYWLGIDDNAPHASTPFKKYMRYLSEQGMITNFSTRTSVYDVHQMIEEHRQTVVDVTALTLECVIAQGATSIVMRGAIRGITPIALKIYTSVHVTEEEVYRFSRETALNIQLSHPNVVKFYGLCVVPPSISLVFEFCEYGGLDGILKNGNMSTLSMKLRAWLDACHAVAYLHSFSPPLLHRDIKTDNFLVGQNFVLKLADFGEANLLRPRSDGTMTIAGTVDYMAPEMIVGGKTARYDTGVDVYSLMITLWQIMVPECSPWEGKTHLQVYRCVTKGERPPLLPRIPDGCAQILEAGWVGNPSDRIAIEDIIPKVHQLWLTSIHQKTLKRTKPQKQ